MPYTLVELSNDIRSLLNGRPAAECAIDLCQIVKKAALDKEFVAQYLTDRSDGEAPREIIYEDPELGFCICGHVYNNQAIGDPHDHGRGWALYGQAVGTTEMTDWEIIGGGNHNGQKQVRPVKTYLMAPGDVHFYNVGAVHSPKRIKPTKILRIESENLDHVPRSDIKAASD
jgi:hypothetical protein